MLIDGFSAAMNIYQPVLRHNNFAKAPDMHFARDTHMRIILGNSSNSAFGKDKKGDQDSNSKSRYDISLWTLKKKKKELIF